MLTQYKLTLQPEKPCSPRPEWAYRLYAALLAETSQDFAVSVHQSAVTPVSQFLRHALQCGRAICPCCAGELPAASTALLHTNLFQKRGAVSSSAHDASNCAKPDEKVERLHFRMPD